MHCLGKLSYVKKFKPIHKLMQLLLKLNNWLKIADFSLLRVLLIKYNSSISAVLISAKMKTGNTSMFHLACSILEWYYTGVSSLHYYICYTLIIKWCDVVPFWAWELWPGLAHREWSEGEVRQVEPGL